MVERRHDNAEALLSFALPWYSSTLPYSIGMSSKWASDSSQYHALQNELKTSK
jgi:hypothetical protein